MASSGVSHLFERNTRIACGSSCAPSNENYAGTLGALLGTVNESSRCQTIMFLQAAITLRWICLSFRPVLLTLALAAALLARSVGMNGSHALRTEIPT